jgi:hypothetical protein
MHCLQPEKAVRAKKTQEAAMTPRRLVATIAASLTLTAAACKKEQPKAEPPPPVPAAAPTPAPAPAAPAEEAVPDFAADPHHHMKAHFVRALRMQDAVLAGKLDDAKAQARWLATHDDRAAAPEGWRPYLATFQVQAKAVVDAATIDDAAVAVGQIAAACGDCHANNHAKPQFAGPPIFKKAATVKQHMSAQIAALDKLWAGLVVPSDRAWQEGSALLASVVVTEKALAKQGLDKADPAKLLAETLRKLSATAGGAPRAERPQVYAELLTTCVACHTTVRAPVTTAVAPPATP